MLAFCKSRWWQLLNGKDNCHNSKVHKTGVTDLSFSKTQFFDTHLADRMECGVMRNFEKVLEQCLSSFGILQFCTFELFNSLLSYLCFNINHWKKVLAVIILSLEGQQPPRWQITSKTLNANHVLFSKMPFMSFFRKMPIMFFFSKVPIMSFFSKMPFMPSFAYFSEIC